MKKAIAVSVCIAFGCGSFPQTGFGQGTCAGLPVDPSWNVDGVLLYRMGNGPWQVLQTTEQLPHAGSALFVYVVKERWNAGRSGVVVIKTGSSSPAARPNPGHQGAVLLTRSERVAPKNGTCGQIKRFSSRYVSGTSYDAYHNYGRGVPRADSDSLKAYHIHYLGHGDICRDTNDINSDSPLRFDFRSNRSQFSFDGYTVRHGMSQIAASLGFNSALAGTADLANPMVAMRRYQTDENKVACIGFGINVSGPGYFLRINDLDSSQSQGTFYRAYEKSWQLTP
jgi:hypothetical protein